MSFIDSLGFVFFNCLVWLLSFTYLFSLGFEFQSWPCFAMGTNVLPCDTNFPLHPEAFAVPEAKNLWLVHERWNYRIKEAKFDNIFSCGQYSFKIMRTQNNQLMTKNESLLKHCFWHEIANVFSWLIIFIATMVFGTS